MGSGKTTVGRLLAEAMDLSFVDLDGRVEASAGATVAQLFEREGEAGFRARERAAVDEVCRLDGVVVATGGGVMIASENRALMAASGTSIWLDVDFDVLVERLSGQPQGERPLFRDPEQARSLYEGRLAGYRRADLRVEIDREETPGGVAARIARLLEGERCAT